MFRFQYILSFLVQAGKFLLLAGGDPHPKGLSSRKKTQCLAQGKEQQTHSLLARVYPVKPRQAYTLGEQPLFKSFTPNKFKRLYIFLHLLCKSFIADTQETTQMEFWRVETAIFPQHLKSVRLQTNLLIFLSVLTCSILCSLQILNSVPPSPSPRSYPPKHVVHSKEAIYLKRHLSSCIFSSK